MCSKLLQKVIIAATTVLAALQATAEIGDSLTLNCNAFSSGGSATGGVYSLSATIGQPTASGSGSGSYSLASGFWAVEAVALPSQPLLQAKQSGTSLVFSWPAAAGNYVLKCTPNLLPGAVWNKVPQAPVLVGDRYVVTVPMDKPKEFFLLAKAP